MHLLRAGGEYQSRRELWLWIGLAAIVLAALGAALAIYDLVGSLAVVVSAILPARAVAERLSRVQKGQLGERSVTSLLQQLSDDYYLVNDVVLGRYGNVDHVLIGPCGVVVIETKRVAGYIRCYGDEWYVNGRRRRSFSKQVNGGALRVKSFLTEQHRDLPTTAIGYVKSVVVLAHPLCQLEVNRARTTVVRFSQLLELVRDLAAQNQMPAALAARLAESLSKSQKGPITQAELRSEHLT